MLLPASLAALLLTALPSVLALPIAPQERAVAAVAALSQDFPDPSIWKEGSTFYAFATEGNGLNVQMAQSDDGSKWTFMSSDALPNLPSWVPSDNANVWAPDVFKNDNGQFVMFFSATYKNQPKQHCIGVATAFSVTGPYTAQDQPWVCPLSQGGAIDASGFQDTTGTRYVTYKVDGNSIGHGGTCGNTVAPIVATPIMLQKVQGDGFTQDGDATQILDRDDSNGPLVEAPSLMVRDGTYYLYYSSNCYTSTNYDVSWATASSLTGPYTKQGALFATGTDSLNTPGGADVAADGTNMLFHANNGAGGRSMYAVTVGTTGSKVSATGGFSLSQQQAIGS